MKGIMFLLLLIFGCSTVLASQTVTSDVQTWNSSAPKNDHASVGKVCNNWKTSDRFVLSELKGFKGEITSGTPISFYVSGNANSTNVDPSNGFYVAASLRNSKTSNLIGGIIHFDRKENAWKVDFKNVVASDDPYELTVHLLCRVNDSPCQATFGGGTWVSLKKELKVK